MILLADSECPDHCANALANLGLRCLHIPEDTFLHGMAQLLKLFSFFFPFFPEKGFDIEKC